MIMSDSDDRRAPEPALSPEEERACGFLRLVQEGLQPPRATPALKRKEAEALYVDADAAEADEERFRLLLLANQTDPCNAAVLLELKDYVELTLEQDLHATRALVTIAEKRLGRAAFKAYAGRFWSVLETRPYLNARAEYADLLHEAGLADSCVAEQEALLALDRTDRLGMRHDLLPHYLAYGQLAEARQLFDAFPADASASPLFAWCRVLERWLSQDEPGAQAALGAARTTNGYAEAFVLGHRKPPSEPSATFKPGSREEAEAIAHALVLAWGAAPDALRWLAAQPRPKR